jgi:hypothetical protein
MRPPPRIGTDGEQAAAARCLDHDIAIRLRDDSLFFGNLMPLLDEETRREAAYEFVLSHRHRDPGRATRVNALAKDVGEVWCGISEAIIDDPDLLVHVASKRPLNDPSCVDGVKCRSPDVSRCGHCDPLVM